MSLTDSQLANACAEAMLKNDRATQHLEMKVKDISPGAATLEMTIQDFMLNGHESCHGGYIFTLADSCFAFSSNTYNQRTVAQHCSISYLAPVFSQDTLTATAKEVSRHGRNGIYDVSVSNQKGEKIAEFRGFSRTIQGSLISK